MKNKKTPLVLEDLTPYKVYGTVSDGKGTPAANITVKAYSKGMRDKTMLGEAVTAADGAYTIIYTLNEVDTNALILSIYSTNELLKSSDIYYDLPGELELNFELDDIAGGSVAEYDELLGLVIPFTTNVPLSEITAADISFIAHKTGIDIQVVKQLAMSSRFAAFSNISANVWYGILSKNSFMPYQLEDKVSTTIDFENQVAQFFDVLMDLPLNILISALQNAANQHVISALSASELEKIRTELSQQLFEYAKQHPVTGQSSTLYKTGELAGLDNKELKALIEAQKNHTGPDNEFWEQAEQHPLSLKKKKADTLKAVYQTAKLTGHNLQLTQELIKTHEISSAEDIKKLAGNNAHEWAALIKKHKITLGDEIPGKTKEEKIKNYAAQLDASFIKAYPTAAFAARLQKDKKSKLPHQDKVNRFFDENPHFDLLNDHVGTFIKNNKNAVAKKDADAVAGHIRRIQRVAKMTPSYDSAAVLLNDGIHSAHQVYKMGRDNFIGKYQDALGETEATQVFEKANAVHAAAVALTGNLRSMVDASAMNAFPNLNLAIQNQLAGDLPDLDALFGHTDYCACDECNAVYGAPAYLTDILHYLDKRKSQLPAKSGKVPSVKDLLMQRRPDLGDIDLQCDNTNTEIPYIDIACEIMEDYIAPPVITLANTFLASFVKGGISPTLLTAIKAQLTAAGQSATANQLTAAASVSDSYTVQHLQADNTYLQQTHWIIRDTRVTLKASNTIATGTVEVRVLHQTQLSADAVAAGPQYVNTNVYNNFLKTAKRPFSLPFDLFETEGALYLEKLGVTKPDLIDIFRKEDKTAPGASFSDVRLGYASLGIVEAEQSLIFTVDAANQALYWGTAAAGTAIAVNIFEQITGLNYAQVIDLIQLQFVNPAKDIVIEHDDLSANTATQRVTNLTGAKLDTMHRFLRLWRKTTLSMSELDAIIMSPAIGKGSISSKLALQLHQFFGLQQKFDLDVFQLLAFYQNLDTTHNFPDCLYNQLFQNSAVTNPVNAGYSINSVTAGTATVTDVDKAAIAAILQLSVSDLTPLLAKTNGHISLANLSLLYKHAQLARSLNITVPALLNLLSLIDANPFQNLQATTLFLQKYQLLQSTGISVDELNYILRHQDNANHTLVPSSMQVSTNLTQLQNDLLTARAIAQPAADNNGLLLSKWLSDNLFKWDAGLLTKLIDILNTVDDTAYQQKVDNNSNLLLNLRMVYHDSVLTADLAALPIKTAPSTQIVFPASIAAQLFYDADKKQLKLTGYMSTADKTALLALSKDLAYQAAINTLFAAAQQTDSSATNIFFATTAEITSKLKTILGGNTSARFAYFINKLAPVYKNLLQQDVLIKDLSTLFSTDKKVITQMLSSVPAIYTDFTDDNFVNKIPSATSPYLTQVNRYQLTAKICFLTTRLHLTDMDLAFILAHAADINSLNFLTLPVTAGTAAVTTFAGFEIFINLLKFQQFYPAKTTDTVTGTILSIYIILTDAISQGVLTGTALTAYIAKLVADLSLLTGWDATALAALISPPTNYITLTLPADIKSVPVLMRLHQRLTLLQQLGITAIDAFAWAKDSLLPADTAKIKQVLKQKYSNSDWLQVSKPLQDTLREKKRDALIAYLLTNPGTQTWKTTDDLYSYFLLDVEMCSCQPTSRIVQATNTVQLFVQRCFLQLEANINVIIKADPRFPNLVPDADWSQWQWMKNFRVWQANSKVFLYPENYIEPELLPADVKSPFFADLENDLLQGEVTAANVETAFGNYLDKLSGVARLEIKGMWYDDPSQTLHVFGRTYGGDPKVYYYRKFIEGRRWTPWTKVDLDINSDFIMPLVYNNHVYLYWAIIKDQKATVAAGTDAKWLIQLAYSEFKNGKWTPKKISGDSDTGQIVVLQSAFSDKSRFFFAPLDAPTFDYTTVHPITNPAADLPYLKSILNAVSHNGSFVINCSYYSTGAANPYVGTFQIDIATGYAVKINAPANLELTGSDNSRQTHNLVNMLETESSAPPITRVPSSNTLIPDQSRGRFTKVVSMQMSMMDRYTFISQLSTQNIVYTGALLPYFYQDQHRTYFIRPEFSDNSTYELPYEDYLTFSKRTVFGNVITTADDTKIKTELAGPKRQRYYNFYHPMIGNFMQRLFIDGVDGLLDRNTQLKGDAVYDTSADKFNFATYYKEFLFDANNVSLDQIYTGPANQGLPAEDVDFSLQSGYGLYNWELFYHAPLMIAERLSQNQQFDDADRWYKYIFNPMDTSPNSAPNKYWNTKPFFEATSQDYLNERIDNILKGVNTGKNSSLLQDVTDWRNNPFQPHYIAQYRTVAYQKVAVMKYIGHLIRYGDYLFAQDTMESVSQATQLYILAAEILGPKPETIPSAAKNVVDNYYQLEQKLDAMSDAMVNVENLLPLQTVKGYTGTTPSAGLPNLQNLYFCVPQNENLTGPTGYWDIVADRLFKIRHCMNIDGTTAPLSLFSPAVDPAMLVRATAGGLDIGSILNDMNAPLPFYRFTVMVQKATELSNEVKSLGSLMLSVLEKKDAEAMSLLRSGQEIKLSNAVLLIKKRQIDDAQLALDNLIKQKELIAIRQQYFKGLKDEGISTAEGIALALNGYSTELDVAIALSYILGSGAAAAPTFTGGASGFGVAALASDGGMNAAESAANMARNFGAAATGLDKIASLIMTNSSYDRRRDEWSYQVDLANKELEQIDKQIASAQIRLDVANRDMNNQQLMIDQAGEVNDFMRSKFTNEDLYSWMITQVSATYFKSYQLAYDVAKKTEQSFRYELGLADSAYINFGYWDSLKKGLLAGEQLSYDLKNMEMAYYEQNKRELELVKPISLSQLDPVALLKLKTTKECWISLPEELFDMDYPGHYMRRIKSVSVTIPCIAGPYNTVNCKLTLTNNSVRTSGLSSADATQYPRKMTSGTSPVPTDDPRFRDSVGALQSMATSHAQNDSGLFELNFRDERYLPFEGAGAISLWHLELPAAISQFDYKSISDVIIHLKYTARDGGDLLRSNAVTSLNSSINKMLVSVKDTGLMRIFSAKNDLPQEWYKFLNPLNTTDDQVLTLNLDKTRFPLFTQNKAIKIKSIELIADTTLTAVNGLLVTPMPTSPATINLTKTQIYGSWLSTSLVYNNDPGTWLIKNPVAHARITDSIMNNMIIIVHYEVK